ncbi:MAG TPA: flagellar assembly protein FliW [Verrucomicrobiae bacterium]|jgi:flagellar assembly factor FliW
MNTIELMEPEVQATKPQEVIQLPLGLLGFERVKKYILLAKPGEEPFMWFQMIEDAKKAFLVIQPYHVVPNYQPDISEQDVEFLDLINPAEALVLNIVTLRGHMKGTANLRGPIIINRRTLIGKQVIPVNAAQYAIKHPLPVS